MPTRGFATILAVVCLLPAGLYAEDSKGNAELAGPVLDRVATMDSAQQQAWLARLEQRASHAARLTLDADEAARQQARIASLLHRNLVTWQVLQTVVEETNTRERQAIDILALRYRSRVSDAANSKTNVANQRQADWLAVYRDWKAAGEQFDGQDRLIDWLEAAINGIRIERTVAMPQKPDVEALPALAPEPLPVVTESSRSGKAALTPGPSPATDEGRHSEANTAPVARLAAEPVQVNVDELSARIAGNNLGFRTLESELDESRAWNAARLEPLAERLKVLVVRHNDLELFRQLTSEANRSSLGPMETPKSAISQLAARIVEARKLTSGTEFQGTDAERQAELERLEALSRALAELAQK